LTVGVTNELSKAIEPRRQFVKDNARKTTTDRGGTRKGRVALWKAAQDNVQNEEQAEGDCIQAEQQSEDCQDDWDDAMAKMPS
jgi:hypothetical protein